MRPSLPRFNRYGLFNAHTGKQKKRTYEERGMARAALFASGDHALRVRGVPGTEKRKAGNE
jgi:hypothetical protein